MILLLTRWWRFVSITTSVTIVVPRFSADSSQFLKTENGTCEQRHIKFFDRLVTGPQPISFPNLCSVSGEIISPGFVLLIPGTLTLLKEGSLRQGSRQSHFLNCLALHHGKIPTLPYLKHFRHNLLEFLLLKLCIRFHLYFDLMTFKNNTFLSDTVR